MPKRKEKIEVTENYIRIPNPKHKGTGCKKIRTIDVSKSKGIKGLYCVDHKAIKTYLFDKDKWTIEEARRWVKEHSKGLKMEDKKLHVKASTKIRDKKIVAVASEEVEDREGEVLSIDGWVLKDFKKNPQLLWYHNLRPERSLPIGTVKKIGFKTINGKRKLVFEPEFEDITEFGRTIGKFYQKGYLNAFSVGFRPMEREKNKYLKQELLEISAVPVGSLPTAEVIQRAEEDGFNKVCVKALMGDKKATKKVLENGKKELDGGELNEPTVEERLKAMDEKIENLFKIVKGTRRDVRKAAKPKRKVDEKEVGMQKLIDVLKITSQVVNIALKKVKEEKAKWTRRFINNLPDAAFAYIEPGGEKDETGKTKPRSLRHYPHHGPSVKKGTEHNTVDKPHLRNALARIGQGTRFGAKAKPHLVKHAKALDIGDY